MPSRSAMRPIAIAALVALGVLAALEVGWRRLGFAPMPRDTVQLWARERGAVQGSAPVIAIVGSSRAQLGLDPRVLAADFATPTHQLAITGGSPLPVLQDLANDDDFHGLVICEVTPSAFFVRTSEIAKQSGADWVAAWRQLPMVTAIETWLRVRLQTHLALLEPQTNLRFQLSSLLTEHTFAKPKVAHERADRYRAADYRHEDVAKLAAHWAKGLRASKPATPEELAELSRLVASWVASIRSRGGDVVFVRMVSSGQVADTEREMWPRAAYWDVFTRSFDSHAIYYSDYPELSTFTAPEGSHLDAEQAGRFSHELAGVLRRQHWVR